MLVCPEHVKLIDIICSMKLSNQQAWLKIYCDHGAMAPHLCDSLRRHHDNRVIHICDRFSTQECFWSPA